jgi:hypothetical protein
MSIRQVGFNDVFDGKANYAPEAIVSLSLEDIARQRDLAIETGEDGLDRYAAIPLEISHWVCPEPIRFALWRHDGNPSGTFAIHMAVGAPYNRRCLPAILDELGIGQSSILWQPPG